MSNCTRTLGWNWNCTTEPTGAVTLSGKYFKEPFASATETTCTISWPGAVEAGGQLPVGMAWHPAGHDGAAAPQAGALSLLPQLLHPPLPYESVARAVAASNVEIRTLLRDMVFAIRNFGRDFRQTTSVNM